MDIDNGKLIDERSSDGLAVAPPEPQSKTNERHPVNEVRDANDAADVKALKRDPSDEDAKLDIALDESFPTSDAPSNTQPGKGKDPAPSSGYDAEAERKLAAQQR